MDCPACGAENELGAEVCFHCRSVLAAVTRGTLLAGRYEILAPLGRGGMGLVFKAHDRRLDETVAIKLLRPEAALEPDAVSRIQTEIKLARRVSHRNVCRIYEFGEDAGRSFIAMEYVDGVELKELVRAQGGLASAEAFAVALQIAEGLEAIHEAGIVHRDLKTANIMRDGRGVVRLMDFGIARQVARGTTDGSRGRLVGTPDYMSPEQVFGGTVDFRSDIYALGVVIFELFTGEVPFKSDSPVALLHMHLHEQPTLDSNVAERLPVELVPVLRRALARPKEERYASAAELRDALVGVAAGGTARLSADSAPAARMRRLPAFRRSATRWAGLAAVLAMGVGLGVALRPGGGTQAPREAATLRDEGPAQQLMSSERLVPEGHTDEAPLGSSATEPSTAPQTRRPATAVDPPAVSTRNSLPGSGRGRLRMDVKPFAEVTVNGVPYGKTPLPSLGLAAGRHVVRFVHPRYRPIQRKITIRAGEETLLRLDFAIVGIPR